MITIKTNDMAHKFQTIESASAFVLHIVWSFRQVEMTNDIFSTYCADGDVMHDKIATMHDDRKIAGRITDLIDGIISSLTFSIQVYDEAKGCDVFYNYEVTK